MSSINQAVESLKAGNLRFTKNQKQERNLLDQVAQTKDGQKPFAVVISCMDSRTAPELIFDQGIGDIFTIRVAGNVITPEIIGSAEYACKAVGSKVILVLGHTGCGAIKGAMDNAELGHLHSITDRIKPCIEKNASADEVTVKNVHAGTHALIEESSILRDLVNSNELKIIGGVYDIKNGQVTFYE